MLPFAHFYTTTDCHQTMGTRTLAGNCNFRAGIVYSVRLAYLLAPAGASAPISLGKASLITRREYLSFIAVAPPGGSSNDAMTRECCTTEWYGRVCGW
jgi:hypothetical protein